MTIKNRPLTLLKLGLALSSGISTSYAAAVPGGSLDPNSIPKYTQNLLIPPGMPLSDRFKVNGQGVDYYEIGLRQFNQQILPSGFPQTTVWGYGSINHPETFHYPAYTIKAKKDRPVRVKWYNELVDKNGDYLPHLLTDSVDQTLHWANPAQQCKEGTPRTDCRGDTDIPYTGPVPMVPHLHGAHVGPGSDGYPESWWLPAANNIPPGYATEGGKWDEVPNNSSEPGAATYQYPNDQSAATLWYHDHTLGMTRQGVYAGAAGFYLLKDDIERSLKLPRPSARRSNNWADIQVYDIPLLIQDRSFNADGSLFYPINRAFFEGLAASQLQIPFAGDNTSDFVSDIAPIWNPETFFNTIVVNGNTWPKLDVEKRRYRFRILNGANSRTFNFKLVIVESPRNPALVGQEIPFYQIGSDGGLLSNVIKITTGHKTVYPGRGFIPAVDTPVTTFPEEALLLMPAERADVIVDFAKLPKGTVVRMLNDAPDAPFGGFPDAPADPATTGQIMQFVVGARINPLYVKKVVQVQKLKLPQKVSIPVLNPGPMGLRQVTLNEEESLNLCIEVDANGDWAVDANGNVSNWAPCTFTTSVSMVPFAPKEALLGTQAAGPLTWMAPMTELPGINTVETWEIINNTEDAHPIHQHLIQFQVVDRESMLTGVVRSPEANETGWKDTVIVYPGEKARVTAKYDHGGLFVWHCHILEHEDHEMMRPFCVTDNPANPSLDCNGVN